MVNKNGFNAFELKIIAIIAMTLDHLSKIIPAYTTAGYVVLLLMNSLGRITMPIMCFFVAEGFYHTRSLKKYLCRMFVFAIISQIPFYLLTLKELPADVWEIINGNMTFNAIYTLFMGLLALTIAKADRMNIIVKVILLPLVIMLTYRSDWLIYGVLWVLSFGLFRGDFKKQAIIFAIITIFRCVEIAVTENLLSVSVQICTLLALPFLYQYNGQQGKRLKYGFYIFYPAHMLVLGLINLFNIL